MSTEEARKQYKAGKISFLELDKIYFENASKEEIDAFYAAPVWDRPLMVKGLSSTEIDAQFSQQFAQ